MPKVDLQKQWYRMPASDVLHYFSITSTTGLTDVQVELYAKRFGTNKPAFIPRRSWELYTYKVTRNSVYVHLPIDQLTIGDCIVLKKGDIVPATIRLLRSTKLGTLEHAITGYAGPAYKNTFASKSLLSQTEQKNMLWPDSTVTSGHCVGIIVGLAQKGIYKTAHNPKRTLLSHSLAKKNVIVQKDITTKVLQSIDTVVFDDLQQTTEIIRLLTDLYMNKHINCVFLVKESIGAAVKKQLPDIITMELLQLMHAPKNIPGIVLVKEDDIARKSSLVAALQANGLRCIYAYRGDADLIPPNLATLTCVISTHATQEAIRHADIVAKRISPQLFSSILYNKI